MGWVILIILGTAALATLFVVLTDGRYFGKRLTRWIYDRFGPAIFGAHSEARRWRALREPTPHSFAGQVSSSPDQSAGYGYPARATQHDWDAVA